MLIAREPVRPVFDKRITALNFAGFAVLAVNGKGAEKAALEYLASARDLDGREPLLLNPDGLPVADRERWSGVVTGPGQSTLGTRARPGSPGSARARAVCAAAEGHAVAGEPANLNSQTSDQPARPSLA